MIGGGKAFLDSPYYEYSLEHGAIAIRRMALLREEQNETFMRNSPAPELLRELCLLRNGKSRRFQEAADLDFSNRITLKNVETGKGTMYLAAMVRCKTRMSAVLYMYSEYECRLWVNSAIAAAAGESFDTTAIIVLNPGENWIVAEFPFASDQTMLALWLNPLKQEVLRRPVSMIFENPDSPLERIQILSQTQEIERGRYVFQAIPMDMVHLDLKQMLSLHIFYHNTQEEYSTQQICFYQCVTLVFPDSQKGKRYQLQLVYRTKSKSVKVYEKALFQNFKQYEDMVANRTQKILVRDDPKNMGLQLALRYYQDIRTLYQRTTQNKVSELLWEEWEQQKQGCPPEKQEHKQFRVYYKSMLDERPFMYQIILPEKYTSGKEYPLLILFSVSLHFLPFSRYAMQLKEPYILVHISARGVTMGSYVGEATIQESLSDVIRRFSVDCSRIYVTGFSNGASSAWAQLESMPHRFAGAVLISGSMYPPQLRNVRNIPLYNISSQWDYLFSGAYEVPRKRLMSTGRCKGLLADQMTHNQLQFLQFSTVVYNQLFQNTRNPYPNNVSIYTERNRHSRAYWVKLDGIAYGHKGASLCASIRQNHITVSTVHAAGFTLKVPAQLLGGKFSVTVNRSHTYQFYAGKQDTLHFVARGHGYQPSRVPAKYDLRKGTGLLDVFLGPLRIILSDSGAEALQAVAEVFSHPVTNGLDSSIQISYPVISLGQLGELCRDVNYVVIDQNVPVENPLLQQLRSNCRISMDESGYRYLDEKVTAPYCIMQVFPHPLNEQKSVLYINANDSSLFRRNLFLRSMLLPSYSSGYHVYLNSQALLYSKNVYYTVQEWGLPLEAEFY